MQVAVNDDAQFFFAAVWVWPVQFRQQPQTSHAFDGGAEGDGRLSFLVEGRSNRRQVLTLYVLVFFGKHHQNFWLRNAKVATPICEIEPSMFCVVRVLKRIERYDFAGRLIADQVNAVGRELIGHRFRSAFFLLFSVEQNLSQSHPDAYAFVV